MTNQPKKATARGKNATSKNKTPPTYFLTLDIRNVLCFKGRQQLNLCDSNGYPAQWTVILGNNGVGKTTILRCLAGMEMTKYSSIQKKESYRPILGASRSLWDMWQELIDIENSIDTAAIRVDYVSKDTLSNFHQIKYSEIPIARSFSFVYIGKGCKGDRESSSGLICYGYGATRRIGESYLGDSNLSFNSASLFSDNATLINAEEWLLQTDYAIKSSSGEIHIRLKKEFERIIEILKRILPDVENIRITPAGDIYPRPKAEFLTPYGWVRLSSLGLGYRTTIAWMVDLAVRLFKRYPDSEDPLAEPAIVLVDEIDLHMHPQWQRTIMEFLTERFPNTQFIVTAHSPLVVQAAQDANIVLLRREGDRVVIDNNPEIIENWRVDQVLTSVFEMPSSRPAKIEPLLARRQEILTKSKLTKADKSELKELEEKIGTLPTAETSEDIKAMDIIRRAAKLLEKSGAEAVE